MNSKTPVGIRAAIVGGIAVILAAIVTVMFQDQRQAQPISVVVNNNNSNTQNQASISSTPTVIPRIEEINPALTSTHLLATSTNTPIPTNTFTPIPTNTPIPPTPTFTVIPTNTPIPPTATFTFTPIPPLSTNTPSPTPSQPVVLDVYSKNLNGTAYNLPNSGTYRISYISGFYSTGSAEQGGKQSRTAVFVYRNSSPQWGGTWNEPTAESFRIGCKEQNECASMSVDLNFSAGESLIFLTVDDVGSYGDNDGSVQISITQIQ